jgi:hypothetical protein
MLIEGNLNRVCAKIRILHGCVFGCTLLRFLANRFAQTATPTSRMWFQDGFANRTKLIAGLESSPIFSRWVPTTSTERFEFCLAEQALLVQQYLPHKDNARAPLFIPPICKVSQIRGIPREIAPKLSPAHRIASEMWRHPGFNREPLKSNERVLLLPMDAIPSSAARSDC